MIVFIYFQSKNIDLFGIHYGFFVGLTDTFISSNLLEKVEDDKNSTKQYSVLVVGFFMRMLLMLGGGFALENVEKYLGISFALTYLATHFAHIGGFAMFTMRKSKEEQVNVGNNQQPSDTDSKQNEQD